MIGTRCGRLLVIAFLGSDKFKKKRWSCRCDCGNEVSVDTARLRAQKVLSCGCLKTEVHKARHKAHREDIFSKAHREGECLIYDQAKDSFGYGRVGYEGKNHRAHRIAYILAVGPIPDGIDVLHRCDTPACIEPNHLFLGTHQENMKDMVAKGRWRHGGGGRDQAMAVDVVAEIRQKYDDGKLNQSQLAREYNVSQPTIYRIVKKKSYR